MLGFDTQGTEGVPVDEQGQLRMGKMPDLDAGTIVVVQAGNVNSGAFDSLGRICAVARKAGVWGRVNGALGFGARSIGRGSHLSGGGDRVWFWPETTDDRAA